MWNNKRARVRLSLLYLPYNRGGLQFPNLQWYYWAAQLRSTLYYFSSETHTSWSDIESFFIKSKLSLNLYLIQQILNLSEKTKILYLLILFLLIQLMSGVMYINI